MNQYNIINPNGQEVSITAEYFAVKDNLVYFYSSKEESPVKYSDAVGMCNTNCIIIKLINIAGYENR